MSSQYLWCNVVWCTTEGGGGVPRTETLLAHAIISELHMTVLVQQHIVQLQITVDNAWEGGGEGDKEKGEYVWIPFFL